jgi:hypothetical protein
MTNLAKVGKSRRFQVGFDFRSKVQASYSPERQADCQKLVSVPAETPLSMVLETHLLS